MKTIVFDIDDTLITDNSWVRLHIAAGMTKQQDYELYNSYQNKIIDYSTWTATIEEIYREKNILTKEGANKVLTEYKVRDGVEEVIKIIRLRNYKPILMTGGFLCTAQHLAKSLAIDTWFACTDINWSNKNTFINFISDGDEGEFKLKTLNRYCEQTGDNIRDCIVVGDSNNDIPIFEATGNGVCFTWCKPDVKAAAKYVITDIRDLPTLLDNL